MRPWLYRIAHNAAINSLKKVGEAMEEVPESAGGFATEPAAELERRDEMQQALTSIAALPSRQRAALLAVAVDGRAHADVAQELGLTDGAVRQLVHRARTTLRTGATAITPLPLLHAMVASAGDSTVGRVAEVAAGAGGAGAASLSLKAGAAAVLATGALVTGGPQVAHVVHPSQRASQPAAQSAARPGRHRRPLLRTRGRRSPVRRPAKPRRPRTGASSSSGPTHKQRRRGQRHRSDSAAREQGPARAERGARPARPEHDERQDDLRPSPGVDVVRGPRRDESGSRKGGGEQEGASGKHKATRRRRDDDTAKKRGGGGGEKGGDEDLVASRRRRPRRPAAGPRAAAVEPRRRDAGPDAHDTAADGDLAGRPTTPASAGRRRCAHRDRRRRRRRRLASLRRPPEPAVHQPARDRQRRRDRDVALARGGAAQLVAR